MKNTSQLFVNDAARGRGECRGVSQTSATATLFSFWCDDIWVIPFLPRLPRSDHPVLFDSIKRRPFTVLHLHLHSVL